MQLHLLHLDDALELQSDFMRTCRDAGASEIMAKAEGDLLRLWARPDELTKLKKQLSDAFSKRAGEASLFFMGSGDFHHITSLLLELALEQSRQPITLIHFDNHPDWVHFKNGVHCGSWVNRAAANPLVKKIITLGVCSSDLNLPEWKGANLSLLRDERLELYPYDHAPSRVWCSYGAGASHSHRRGYIDWRTIADCGEADFVSRLISRIGTEAVYITIDKDVLARDEAVTNWDQGQMRLPFLLEALRVISGRHRIVGADVIGDYSRPIYRGPFTRRIVKNIEVMLDQPAGPDAMEHTIAVNSALNHQLLHALSGMMVQ
ncbi:arginase [Ochrobactrum sp. P6BS-III]|uniref:arginase family protein n=1 Tax=unclassified Ochrobactrum TaxID=239106 RepID=UPI0009944F6B|nr:arginase family enzyme [Ochrobactrum sp. P6BSIII]OOL15119.1 arginase [Ochrobactrum sp. P6BS-III]